jgi:shikimate kinase
MLSKLTNTKLIDIDELILKISGKSSINKIFEEDGDQKFREIEKEALYLVLKEKNQIIATGGGTFIYNPPEILKSENLITINDKIIYLEASFETCKHRCSNSAKRPLFKDISKAKNLYDSRLEKYNSMSDFKIKIDNLNTKQISSLIINYLNQAIT